MPAPEQAPPGVTLRFLPRPSGAAWAAWLKQNPAPARYWDSRPIITPRLLLVHTNGASGEGNAQSAYNWSMAAPNNTKAHYQVDRDGSAVKFLPSNRKGIGNYLAADWSLVVETADPGYGAGKPGQAAGFTPAQAETVAQIIAWEAELWGFDIDYPNRWDGTGVACHTEPFGYPFWTNANGKVCPGRQKKVEVVDWIMPRARDILDPLPPPMPPVPNPPTEDDMPYVIFDLVDSKATHWGTSNRVGGPVMSVRWSGPGSDVWFARRAQMEAEPTTEVRTASVGNLITMDLEGAIPFGDIRDWTGDEYANAAEIKGRG